MSDTSKAAVADVRAIIRTIRDRRIRTGITIGQIAEQVGVSAGAYSQWEVGGTFPPSRGLAAAAQAVGLRLTLEHADLLHRSIEEAAQ